VNRRHFLAASALPLVSIAAPGLLTSARAQPVPFDRSVVRQMARDLAGKSFKAPDNKLPDNLKDLDYDRYRAIRFLPERALWRGEKLPFEAQFFHRGFFYTNRVDIYEVKNGQAAKIAYQPDRFSFGDLAPPGAGVDLGFAGFRLHAPINKPDYYDEVCVFLGASYFRAVAKGQLYGLSARGLAINTGEAKGEEFPSFKAFWIEKPAANANSIVVHALLDSESAAYRFTIRPGDTTVFDVEMAIYPRIDLERAGLMPMTSMFFFGPNDRKDVDDFRPSVHDSDGLAVFNGRGEELWRPLHNPKDLQISSFADLNPRGFGLMQRQKDFFAYQDLESSFERRPSLWAEPIGDWGEGMVSTRQTNIGSTISTFLLATFVTMSQESRTERTLSGRLQRLQASASASRVNTQSCWTRTHAPPSRASSGSRELCFRMSRTIIFTSNTGRWASSGGRCASLA
jgi:glucans biosynthesis protein